MPTISIGEQTYETLAAAIEEANANATIQISVVGMPSGGYEAGVHISQSLNIIGVPDGGQRPILKAPTDTAGSNGAVLYITGSSTIVTMSELSITGTGHGDDDFTFGIRVADGGALNLSNSDVTDIISSPDSIYTAVGWVPGFTGVGIYVGGATAATADIYNVTFTGYERGGVIVDGEDSHAEITYSMFNGQFTDSYQYGIRVMDGATAHIADNQIQNHLYDGSELNFGLIIYDGGAGTIVENNTFYNNDIGLYNRIVGASSIADATMIRDNTFTAQYAVGMYLDQGIANIQGNTITDGWYGIYAVAFDANTEDSVGVLTNNEISDYSESETGTEDQDEFDAVVPLLITNHAPTLAEPGDRENLRGDEIAWEIDAADEDEEDTLIYDAIGLPDGVSINHETGAIGDSIATNADVDAPYWVTVTVSDGVVTTSRSFTWFVSALVNVDNPGLQISYVGSSETLPLYWFTDSENTPVFALSGLPTSFEIDSSGTITGNPVEGDEGTYTATVTATDTSNEASATRTFTWIVLPAPDSIADPTDTMDFPNPGDQTDAIGDTVELYASVISAPTSNVSYSYTGTLPPGLDFDTSNGKISGTITASAETTNPYVITVTATNTDTSATESETFDWFVTSEAPTDWGNIDVTLPNAGAQVFIDGTLMTSTGTERTYSSPPIGGPTTYTLRVTYVVQGFNVVDERQVEVTPGNTTAVDFTQPGSTPLRASAQILVSLPTAEATVTLDGNATTSTGSQRLYTTNPLASGANYSYSMTVAWVQDSVNRSMTVTVQVTPGTVTQVNLSTPPGIFIPVGQNGWQGDTRYQTPPPSPTYAQFYQSRPYVQGVMPVPQVPYMNLQGQASTYGYAYYNNQWIPIRYGQGHMLTVVPGFEPLRWGPLVAPLPANFPGAPPLPTLRVYGGRFYNYYGPPGVEGGFRLNWSYSSPNAPPPQ